MFSISNLVYSQMDIASLTANVLQRNCNWKPLELYNDDREVGEEVVSKLTQVESYSETSCDLYNIVFPNF